MVIDYEDRSGWFHPCSVAFPQAAGIRASPEGGRAPTRLGYPERPGQSAVRGFVGYPVQSAFSGPDGGHISPELAAAAAQVHATLALAAAIYAAIPAPGLPSFPDPGDFPDFRGGAAPGR